MVLLEIIIPVRKSGFLRNPFDSISPLALRSMALKYWIIAMLLEAFTALCGVMSACIFIAHAYDGYLSRS
jgi:hypothetical protein